MIEFKKELDHLLEQNNLTYDDLKNIEDTDIDKIISFFEGNDYLGNFVKEVIIPISNSQIDLKPNEIAIFSVYYRMYALNQSILKFDQTKHFQALASITRGLFELYIDLILLIENLIPKGIEKYNFYPEYQKYKLSKKIVEFAKKSKDNHIEFSKHEKYINDNESNIIKNLIELWGKTKKDKPRFPVHWSGLDTRKRTQIIDKNSKIENACEELYVLIFPFYSWYVHSDHTGILNYDKEFFDRVIALSYSYCYKIFTNATKIFGEFTNINKAYEKFSEVIQNISISPGYFLLKRKIKSTEGSNKEDDLTELLNIYMNVIEANKGIPAKNDLRVIDAEGLAIKLYSHTISILYLYRGINIPDLIIPIKNYPDPPSVDVLVRAAFETFLVFYYVFIDSSEESEIDFKYQSWELSGLYQRQKFPATLEDSIKKLAAEKKLIIELEEKIKQNTIYNSLLEKQKKSYFSNLKKNRWRSIGWAEIALSAGFSEQNSKIIYGFLCEHAHSGNISATQVSQSADFQVRRDLMEAAFGHLIICIANMIYYYCQYFPKSKEYYDNNFKEPNVVSFWIDIGREN